MKYCVLQDKDEWAVFIESNDTLRCVENRAKLTEDNLDFNHRLRVEVEDEVIMLIGMKE